MLKMNHWSDEQVAYFILGDIVGKLHDHNNNYPYTTIINHTRYLSEEKIGYIGNPVLRRVLKILEANNEITISHFLTDSKKQEGTTWFVSLK